MELAKINVNLAKYQSIWQSGVGENKSQLGKIPEHSAYTLALCLFVMSSRRACKRNVIGVRDEITIARTSYSLAWLRHNPSSQHSSRLLRAPSNALSLQLCAHVTQHCVVAVICVCVNEAVVSDLKLRVRLLICWFGFFPNIEIIFRFEVMGFFRDGPICILLLSSLAAIEQAGQILDC